MPVKSKSCDDIMLSREDTGKRKTTVRSASTGNLSELVPNENMEESKGCCRSCLIDVMHLDTAQDICFAVCLLAYFLANIG